MWSWFCSTYDLIELNCAVQLSPIYTVLFNKSQYDYVATLWKTTKIVPVLAELNDYRPLALTSLHFNCLERITLNEQLHYMSNHLDTYQFAYRKGRTVEDATLCFVNYFQ